MRQEINLFTAEFIPKRVWCSFNQSVCIAVLTLLAMVYYSVEQYRVIKVLEKEHQNLLVRTNTLESNDIDNLMDKLIDKRNRIENQIAELDGELQEKRNIKRVYDEKQKTVVASFYQMFRDISLKSNADIAISEIGIYGGGEETIISGIARKRESIPDYLSQLKTTPAFSATQFGLLLISRVNSKELYEFTMSRQTRDPFSEMLSQYGHTEDRRGQGYGIR